MTSLIEKVAEAQRNARDEYVELTRHGLSHEVEARAAIQVVLWEMMEVLDGWPVDMRAHQKQHVTFAIEFLENFATHHNIDLTEPKP